MPRSMPASWCGSARSTAISRSPGRPTATCRRRRPTATSLTASSRPAIASSSISTPISRCAATSPLFALDLEGHAFAAVPDSLIDSDARATVRSYRARLGLADETCYANSGVLVIDPERWTQQGLTERLIRYLGDHLDDCYWVDQDALNAVVRGDFQKLSPVWNMMAILWYRSDIAATIAPAVLHYADTSKPWRPLMWRYDRTVTERYREFFRPSPWPNAVSWSGSPAEWAMYLRFRQRAALRWLRRRSSRCRPKRWRRFVASLRPCRSGTSGRASRCWGPTDRCARADRCPA